MKFLFLAGLQRRKCSFSSFPFLLAGVFAAFYCGRLSDKYGTRKKFVYVSGFGRKTSALSIKSFFLTFIVAIVFGAFGTFGAVDMALAVDCFSDSAAKDLGVWHSAMVLPQLIATPIAGAVLDSCRSRPAYAAVFTLAAVYMLLGTVFVRNITLRHTGLRSDSIRQRARKCASRLSRGH